MQSDDPLGSSCAAMFDPCWRCADTITAPYLHSLPHGSVAPDSFTAGLRCAAPGLTSNHKNHDQSPTWSLFKSWSLEIAQRRHTCSGCVTKPWIQRCWGGWVGAGPRRCSGDHRASGWCLQTHTRTHTRGCREPGAGQLPCLLRHVCASSSSSQTTTRMKSFID